MAFQGNHLFLGNFYGMSIYDISNPSKPTLLTSMVCPVGKVIRRFTRTCFSCRSKCRMAASIAAHKDFRHHLHSLRHKRRRPLDKMRRSHRRQRRKIVSVA